MLGVFWMMASEASRLVGAWVVVKYSRSTLDRQFDVMKLVSCLKSLLLALHDMLGWMMWGSGGGALWSRSSL